MASERLKGRPLSEVLIDGSVIHETAKHSILDLQESDTASISIQLEGETPMRWRGKIKGSICGKNVEYETKQVFDSTDACLAMLSRELMYLLGSHGYGPKE